MSSMNCPVCGIEKPGCVCAFGQAPINHIYSTKSIYERAIETFGLDKQEDMLIEEMAELTQAILKNRRKATEATWQNLNEEFVDVEIVMQQILTTLKNNYLNKIRKYKLERLEQLIKDNQTK